MIHQLSNSRRHDYWIRDKRVYASCGESTYAGHRVATRYSHLQVIVTIKRAALMRQVTRRRYRQLHAVWESATRALGSLHQLNAAKVLRACISNNCQFRDCRYRFCGDRLVGTLALVTTPPCLPMIPHNEIPDRSLDSGIFDDWSSCINESYSWFIPT